MEAGTTWSNEAGSKMFITFAGSGKFSGEYRSALGDAEGYRPLTGFYDATPTSENVTVLSWSVLWNDDQRDSHAVTAWTGLYREIDGTASIRSTWILTTEADEESAWEATRVGTAVFIRSEPASSAAISNAP